MINEVLCNDSQKRIKIDWFKRVYNNNFVHKLCMGTARLWVQIILLVTVRPFLWEVVLIERPFAANVWENDIHVECLHHNWHHLRVPYLSLSRKSRRLGCPTDPQTPAVRIKFGLATTSLATGFVVTENYLKQYVVSTNYQFKPEGSMLPQIMIIQVGNG